MKVRFFYFRGCPHAAPALRGLKEVLKDKGIKEEVEVIEVRTEEEAQRYGFLGSPSIKIDGLDIEADRRGDPPSLGCRVYRGPEGMGGVPPKEMIERAIGEALAVKGRR